MKQRSRAMKGIVCLLVLAMGLGVSYAARGVIKYGVHDLTRELPPVITAPRQFGQPPADAIVLFDGTDLSEWVSEKGGPARWKVVKQVPIEAIPKRAGETDAAYRKRLLREVEARRKAAMAKEVEKQVPTAASPKRAGESWADYRSRLLREAEARRKATLAKTGETDAAYRKRLLREAEARRKAAPAKQVPIEAIPKRAGESDAAYRARLLREVEARRRAALANERTNGGYMEVVKKAGDILTKRAFGNCQLHIEWATPREVSPKETGQKRGNSGVFFMGKYELQVLDSYENETYADGQAASIYGQYPPLVNVCRKPGRWQSYDVSFLRPIFDKDGKCIRPARITVFHNAVVVQNNVEIKGSTEHKKKAKYSPHADKLPLGLQDHGNPMRFRNIWIRELPEQPYLIKD